jgi:hypothetical protein
MKKCSYCGKEYPDDATICAVDQHPLVTEGLAAADAAAMTAKASAPTPRVVKPALMTQLRTLHLYLGCIFAPMLLLFAISGIWQTVGIRGGSVMSLLSALHTSHKQKNGGGFANPFWKLLVILMALSFVVTTVLGILMAVKYGKNRRVAYYCLGAGVVVPVLLIVIQLMMR